MARATFVKAARKDIYTYGKQVEAVHEKGKNAGKPYIKLDRTQPRDEKDTILIPKGSGYWTWCFMNGNPHYSLTQPRQSQLTRSEFLSTYYGIQEEIEDWAPENVDEVQEFIDNIKDEVQTLLDDTQERLDNMPEQLQESDTGQMLQERIDECQEIIDQLEAIDGEAGEFDDVGEAEEWLDEKVGEVKDVCFNL